MLYIWCMYTFAQNGQHISSLLLLNIWYVVVSNLSKISISYGNPFCMSPNILYRENGRNQWEETWFYITYTTFELVWDGFWRHVIGFNHGLPCYVKNMSRGTQVDINRGRRPMLLSWLRPEGHVFNIAWQAMIKTYHSMFPLWFNWFVSIKSKTY